MKEYRWNTDDAARAYDVAAEVIHPRYERVQAEILALLPGKSKKSFVVVDLGGGSGRLMARILRQWPNASGILIDQSEAFLALAEERLIEFSDRVVLKQATLQSDWQNELPGPVEVIVSSSAIHHLQSEEKRALFCRCFDALASPSAFINGDEYRPESNQAYLDELKKWSGEMNGAISSGAIPHSFQATIDKWYERNINEFGVQKVSGDDCHETIDVQIETLSAAGFGEVAIQWQERLWAVLQAKKY